MPEIETVRKFWDENPCGAKIVAENDPARYFEEHRRKRYELEPHIPALARFAEFRGKEVLEIGCGIGADGLEFARAGAIYTGVDLSASSISLARQRFQLAGFPGRFLMTNAERLPFPDGNFDHVYSFGVIHHSPSPESVVKEIFRVLRPGGSLCIMIYNRSSINYYVEIMFLRKLFRCLLYPAVMPGLVAKLTGMDQAKLARHREIMIGSGKMSKAEWISINTDGPDCPLARVYNRSEARQLFPDFEEVRTEAWFFNRSHWPLIGPRLPESVARFLGRKWGWHRVVYAKKPQPDQAGRKN